MIVTIPENIEDITLEQFQKYHALNQREGILDHEYNKRCISIFTGLKYRELDNIKNTDYEMLVKDIIKALDTPVDFKNSFTFEGVEYGFIPNFEDITQGEWLDLTEYQGDVDTMHKLMAVLFRPITKRDKFDNYAIETYSGTKERAELFKGMPLNIVNGALVFFLNLSKELKEAIQRSTAAELAKVAKQQTTLRNGDGMHLSTN
jgi:hypothetical protein